MNLYNLKINSRFAEMKFYADAVGREQFVESKIIKCIE